MKNKFNLYPVRRMKPMKIKPVRADKIVKSGIQLAVGMAALGIVVGALGSGGK